MDMTTFARLASRTLVSCLVLSVFAACGEDEPEPEPGAVGTSCDPAAAAPCSGALECTPLAAGGNSCTYAQGANCEPDNDDLKNGGCSETAQCAIPEGGTTAQCLGLSGAECDADNDHCAKDLSCAELSNGEHRCFGEVVLRGQVSDTTTTEGIEAANVIAVDDEGVAVSDVAETDAMGNYELEVPVVRNEDGSPVSTTFTLRGAAQDYQPFPSGVRVALPIEVSGATAMDSLYVVDNALTDIGLIPLDAGERTTISGSIVALEGDQAGEVGGVLVIATGSAGSFSGISDKSGNFTIFNVPAGDYELHAYAVDIQIETETVSVAADPVKDVTLAQLPDTTATVTGNVQIVDAGGAAGTSVILVVEDTFNPDAASGEVPRGLRAPRTGPPTVTGDFTITGVPVGRYVVLAAYENDGLVRDPDTNIAGTDFVKLEVTAGQTTIAIPDSFKVTAALETIGPGTDEPEAVDSKPELVWADDSSENWYDVRVFDAFGNEVWTSLMLPEVSGSATASVQYEGPLDPGMYYQFRVSSWRQPGGGTAAPISTTEDLRGVFFLPAQ